MTNKQPDAQFDWATELSDAQGHVTLSEQEAKEIGARLRSMGEKLKTYEDLDEAANDVQLLRMGYAAARLEIESLQARIKTMAEEHADELMVAHLDGRMRAAQPAGAQQPGAAYAVYAELPDERAAFEERFPVPGGVSWNGSEYVVKDDYLNSYRCDRFVGQWAAWQARASHGQAPAQAAPQADNVLEDAARLDWLLLHISGAEFRRIGVHYSGNARRADVDAARAAQEDK